MRDFYRRPQTVYNFLQICQAKTRTRKSMIVYIKVFPVVSFPSQNEQGRESMKS